MSSESWQNAIRTVLHRLRQPPKIALVGIGSELHGDDAAGIWIVRALQASSDLLLIEAGMTPENHTSALRRFQPDLVLMIDAAQMKLRPGDISVLDLASLDGLSASTHSFPLALTTQYIVAELGCAVLLLGIQPACTDFGAPLSQSVSRAVEEISRELRALYDER